MLKLEDVCAFVKVAEAKGFGRAAYQLCLSKSVVSHRVMRLEHDLGKKLLSRTSRGISLTDAGSVFLSRSRDILDRVEAARQALPGNGAELTGVLRITMPVDYGLTHLSELVARFMAQHPDLECYADYHDECVDMESGAFDLALRLGRESSTSSKVDILSRVDSVVVGTPELIANVGMPQRPADMLDLPCLTYHGLTDVSTWHFRSGDRRMPIGVKGRFRANSMIALLTAARSGLGFATMPVGFVKDDLAAGSLVHVLPAYQLFDLVLGAHYPPGNQPRRNADALVEFLRNEMNY